MGIEGTEGHSPPPEQPEKGIAILIKPLDGESVVFQRAADGGQIIHLPRGEIYIALPPSQWEATKSPVSATEAPTNGLLPENPTPPATEPHSALEKRSWDKPLAAVGEIPESENQKFVLEGNPVRVLGYRVTRKNTRIADFVLATHPEEDRTEYWRIRAFGDQAEKIRDQVQVGQKGVEVTVYGPKYWKGRKKTNDEWIDTAVKGYHAGFIRVPKDQRPQSSGD